MRTIYHLHIKSKNKNLYYGSIKAITDHNSHAALGVGRDTLYRFDWSKKFSNDNITIEKGVLLSTNDVKALKKPGKKRKVKDNWPIVPMIRD